MCAFLLTAYRLHSSALYGKRKSECVYAGLSHQVVVRSSAYPVQSVQSNVSVQEQMLSLQQQQLSVLSMQMEHLRVWCWVRVQCVVQCRVQSIQEQMMNLQSQIIGLQNQSLELSKVDRVNHSDVEASDTLVEQPAIQATAAFAAAATVTNITPAAEPAAPQTPREAVCSVLVVVSRSSRKNHCEQAERRWAQYVKRQSETPN